MVPAQLGGRHHLHGLRDLGDVLRGVDAHHDLLLSRHPSDRHAAMVGKEATNSDGETNRCLNSLFFYASVFFAYCFPIRLWLMAAGCLQDESVYVGATAFSTAAGDLLILTTHKGRDLATLTQEVHQPLAVV